MLFNRYRFSLAIRRNLEEAGLRRPTDIQFKAIPPILDGSDLLAIAQTGSGKTLAYLLPTLELLETNGRRPPTFPTPRAIILVPTHELAKQVYGVAKSMARGTSVESYCVVGGYRIEEQLRALPPPVDLVIATPGRLRDMTRNRYLDLSCVDMLILDEADRMLEMGFRDDIDHALGVIGPRRQTLFFSATISPEIKRLAYRMVRNPIRIEIAPEDLVTRNVRHRLLECTSDGKRFLLEALFREHAEAKILAFVRTQVRAERVVAAMGRVGISAMVLHGGLARVEREAALRAFSEGETRLLVATDLSARGLDIPNVSLVVNYDLPTQPEIYVHRIGRTGRGDRRGVALSFCSPEEQPLRARIEALLGREIEVLDGAQLREEEARLGSLDATEQDWKRLLREEEEYQSKTKKNRR